MGRILWVFAFLLLSAAPGMAEKAVIADKGEVILESDEDKVVKGAVYYGLNAKEITKILEKTPLDFDETEDDWGDPQFLIDVGGKEVILFTYKCEDGKCDDIRMYTYWKIGGKGPDLKFINAWNIEQRWTKAYMDSDNDAVLEIDFDIKDGITEAAFLNVIEIYTDHVQKFSKYLGL